MIRRGNKGTPKRPELAARDVLIFLIGINTELRVNDKTIFEIREGKTNKRREINVGMLQAEIQHFIADKQPDDYSFTS